MRQLLGPETAVHFDTCMHEAEAAFMWLANPSLPADTACLTQVRKTASGSPTFYLTE